jgi:CRISPR/Cas system-associated endonuclease Cas1
MQSYVSATFRSLDCAGGVCVVGGYGVQVRICNRALIVSDGIGRFRRERQFAKALADIKRLIILSHEGAVTLEALRWLNDAGIAFLQIDRDGEVIAASANYGLNDPRLRRALALAPTNSVGLEIARYLISAKLAGQESNLSRLNRPGFLGGSNP